MIKDISILGSTGSIGVQILDVARENEIKVHAMSANTNIDLFEKQIREFRPKVVSIGTEEYARELKNRISDMKVEIYYGKEGLKAAASIQEAKMVATSIVGIAGLVPTLEAINNGKNIALANKETMVTAGKLVTNKAKENNIKIIPVDSEHSAIFQCLKGNNLDEVENIILTASGGPFRGKSIKELENVTLEQALKHPNWAMGSKITIDSATMMNKGLEVIEARWLFDMPVQKIKVIVHPQSIVHSMVEYCDGTIIAQMGYPDMRLPIQYALTHPARLKSNFGKVNLLRAGSLTFEKPDFETFECLKYAFDCLEIGGTMPVVLNAANEQAVELFLNKKIKFIDIQKLIYKVLQIHKVISDPDLDDILEVDRWARKIVMENIT